VNGEFTIHCLTPNGQRLRLHERIAGKRSGSLARAVDFFRVLPHQRQREIRDHLPRGAPTNFRHLRKLPRGLVTLPCAANQSARALTSPAATLFRTSW
jgi:hypothetical protein